MFFCCSKALPLFIPKILAVPICWNGYGYAVRIVLRVRDLLYAFGCRMSRVRISSSILGGERHDIVFRATTIKRLELSSRAGWTLRAASTSWLGLACDMRRDAVTLITACVPYIGFLLTTADAVPLAAACSCVHPRHSCRHGSNDLRRCHRRGDGQRDCPAPATSRSGAPAINKPMTANWRMALVSVLAGSSRICYCLTLAGAHIDIGTRLVPTGDVASLLCPSGIFSYVNLFLVLSRRLISGRPNWHFRTVSSPARPAGLLPARKLSMHLVPAGRCDAAVRCLRAHARRPQLTSGSWWLSYLSWILPYFITVTEPYVLQTVHANLRRNLGSKEFFFSWLLSFLRFVVH